MSRGYANAKIADEADRIGQVFNALGQYTNAQAYYQQSLTGFQTLGDLPSITRVQIELLKL